VELAALVAPRPLLMVSATGDWTRETMEREYPAMQRFYDLFGARDKVHAVRVDAEHNYNRESREAVYAWMARWLKGEAAGMTVTEREFRPDPLPDLMVFADRERPKGLLSPDELTESWISAARRQLARSDREPFRRALLHALGFGEPPAGIPGTAATPVVILATEDAALEKAVGRAGLPLRRVAFTPFDRAAAEAIAHFETYNRTAASQRVADLVAALSREPHAILVADGDAALAGVLAAAVVPVKRAILDVGRFDVGSDAAFLERLYIPGIRRAGDFSTAAAFARGPLVLHNAGDQFTVSGVDARTAKLSVDEILDLLKAEF
jgi:hypothetical protein